MAGVDDAVFRWASLIAVQAGGLAVTWLTTRSNADATNRKVEDVRQSVADSPTSNGFAKRVEGSLERIEGRLERADNRLDRVERKLEDSEDKISASPEVRKDSSP